MDNSTNELRDQELLPGVYVVIWISIVVCAALLYATTQRFYQEHDRWEMCKKARKYLVRKMAPAGPPAAQAALEEKVKGFFRPSRKCSTSGDDMIDTSEFLNAPYDARLIFHQFLVSSGCDTPGVWPTAADAVRGAAAFSFNKLHDTATARFLIRWRNQLKLDSGSSYAREVRQITTSAQDYVKQQPWNGPSFRSYCRQ
jgi:hypothetical protein